MADDKGAEIRAKQKEFLFPCVSNYYQEPLVLQKGKGTALWDTAGRQYLDFFGGILTVSVGHCNEKVNARVKQQIDTLGHVSTLYPTEPIVRLAERLAKLMPGSLKKVFFTNSGTEADETAIMLARLATGTQEVIALRHSYSGRSMLATTMTAHGPWRVWGDQVVGIKHGLAPYCYRCPLKLSYPSCDVACAHDLKELIQTTTTGRVACLIAEPIMGVGGFITPPKEYFQIAVKHVRDHGGLFIADEVQTGFGRTGGKWWGIQQYGVDPDIMTMAKGIANGMPMGVTVARAEVADKWTPMTISTFGGNPISCAAALGTIDVIESEKLVDNAAAMGKVFWNGLAALQQKYPCIGDHRGMGLMQALELVKDPKTKEPDKETVARVFEETRKRGLLVGKGGLYGNVLRLSPALTITKAEIETALEALDESFAAATK